MKNVTWEVIKEQRAVVKSAVCVFVFLPSDCSNGTALYKTIHEIASLLAGFQITQSVVSKGTESNRVISWWLPSNINNKKQYVK